MRQEQCDSVNAQAAAPRTVHPARLRCAAVVQSLVCFPERPMLRVSAFHGGHLHHPQCSVIKRCAARVVANMLGWEEICEQLAREGSGSKAMSFLGAREFSVLPPLLPQHLAYSQ